MTLSQYNDDNNNKTWLITESFTIQKSRTKTQRIIGWLSGRKNIGKTTEPLVVRRVAPNRDLKILASLPSRQSLRRNRVVVVRKVAPNVQRY
mmetsp:Transcript_29900/g.68984  ORF Transcript_29900/g.68984 Transcript_29900/m.68984 type:complete len:92 (+) Transcript_29900:90-365(+)